MREIVYLSERKLRQFVPPPRRLPRPGALRLTTPFGGLDMDTPHPDGERNRLRHLADVHKHIETIAEWYTDPDLRPGQWVQFETPLRCVTLTDAHRDLVLFVDRPGDEDCRLLLHGSVRHLRGWTPTSVDGPPLETVDYGSSLGTAFVTRVGEVVAALTRHRDPAPADHPEPHLPDRGVLQLLHALDADNPTIDTSATMTGYARVTGLLPVSYTH
ncbi:hypothetical protein FNX44_027540 [Streptomyces sp. OF1]|uniref:Uncharacterized protein n=1 Tax=Streptomyces alkaliterrae TaxID=2213162 RepID=A0A5P0YYZ5_9ACTN|nr:SAVMC3_10250 family protein [Streptomyces alkaliterrae]MQS05516.1 hypothetical protein [Streptomyces alkaliterrae]